MRVVVVGAGCAGTIAAQRLAKKVTAAEIDPGAGEGRRHMVRLRSRPQFTSDVTLWAIIGRVPDLAARSGLEVDADGRAVVESICAA